MTGKSSILGGHNDRVKTDVRLSPELTKQVNAMCSKLGIPKNAFYTFAACEALIRLAPLLKTMKESTVLYKSLEKLLQKIKEKLGNQS
jgi:hypothetical protein